MKQLLILIILFYTGREKQDVPDNLFKSVSVFAGTSLCADFSRSFLKIPAGDKCDIVKWNLTFFNDDKTGVPLRFKLEREYGYHVDNRTYKTVNKDTIDGVCRKTTGSAYDPEATLIQLTTGSPEKQISFVKLDDNLIHLLDNSKKLVIGDAGQSFTLSRIK